MDLFPVNIATGKAFCNRVEERRQLKEYIKHGRHTVIIATRRYGKTSLINQTLIELKLSYAIMELTMAVSIEDLEWIIFKNVNDLLNSILPRTTKAKQSILKLFKWLNPEITLSMGGQKIVFHPDQSKQKKVENVSEILKKLDAAAALVNKKVVLVLDEFQQISEIENHSVEAAIRHAMQYSKNVTYIFSGSQRHMLQDMFNSKNRPFYNSCEIMKLDRIDRKDYEAFINEASLVKWKKRLPVPIMEEIFYITEFHPNYINRICGYFWLLNKFPTLQNIKKYWTDFVESKRAEFTEDILRLSKNQRKVLSYFAKNPSAHTSSQAVYRDIGLPEASIRQALRKLFLSDYIYVNSEGLTCVLDPAFRDFIKNL